jgi:hypothetical protein
MGGRVVSAREAVLAALVVAAVVAAGVGWLYLNGWTVPT